MSIHATCWPAKTNRSSPSSILGRRLDGPRQTPRITLLCARFWPDRHGGVEQRMWHVSREMANHGLCVEVVTENRTDAPDYEAIQPNLTVRRLDPMQPGWAWRWPQIPRLRWWLRAIQCRVKPGLIWATEPIVAAAAVLAGRGCDLVFNPAGCVAAMRHVGRVHPEAVTMRRPVSLAWLDRYAYRHAQQTVVSSHNVKRQFERFYGQPGGALSVVGHGTPLPGPTPSRTRARWNWGIHHAAFVTGFVGRLDPCKSVDFLLQAATRLDLKSHDRLLLVGDGPDRRRLNPIVQRLGLSQKVIWTGDLIDPSAAYAAMDVLVLPSVYEAFGLVVLEAMAHRVPVIARRGDDQTVFTAADELIQDGYTGLISDPQDAADLAAKIAMLRGNRPWREALGQRAHQAAAARPWKAVVDDYVQLLNLHPQKIATATRRARAA